MGIFNKLKNIFYDDVEVPELEDVNSKVKKEEKEFKKVEELRKPIIEELKFDSYEEKRVEPVKTENTFSERDLFKPERTFNFTEFDDDEVEEIKPRVNAMELERKNKSSYVSSGNTSVNFKEPTKAVSQPKVFKPSPVISPIYGILNKDYKKENVKERQSGSGFELSSEPRSYDSVRKKAYGTLEDTLNDTLVSVKTEEITATVDSINKEINELQKTAKIEKIISEIEKSSDISIGDLEDNASEIAYEEKTTEIKLNKIDKELDNVNDSFDELTENTLENDLFNLIDSMYDDKED